MGRTQSQSRTPGTSTATQGKPPDYFLVTEKPPSYEEAMSMLPKYAATHSGSLQLNTEGGLEDFLAPHQVPESHPGGATGGCLSHSNSRRGSASPPPAYSSQLSLCASASTSGNSNNVSPPLSNSTSGLDIVQSVESGDTRASTLNTERNNSDDVRNETNKSEEEKSPRIEKTIIKKSEEKWKWYSDLMCCWYYRVYTKVRLTLRFLYIRLQIDSVFESQSYLHNRL